MKLDRYIRIIKRDQTQLKVFLSDWLYENYKYVVDVDGFLYASGNIPVMLVAHMDTVHKETPKTVWMSLDCNKLKSDEGIGGDDRNGIAMILDIVEQLDDNIRPHILFTEDEEVGGLGAHDFVNVGIKPDINFIVELDRKGRDDAVFYSCDNREFVEFIEEFGFKEQYGSFSDISVIAEPLGIAAVNLSSGYYNAHTTNEYIKLDEMDEIMGKVINIIKSQTVPETTKKFEYIKKKYEYKFYKYGDWWGNSYYPTSTTSAKKKKAQVCEYCGQTAVTEDETGLPVCEKCAKELGMMACADCGEYEYAKYMSKDEDGNYHCIYCDYNYK